jgi:beta-glucosidase
MFLAICLSLVAVAGLCRSQPLPFIPPTPAPTPSPPSLPPRPLTPNVRAEIGEMSQFDIADVIIDIPAGVTLENPTKDGITYPAAAIEYGLWFDEARVSDLVNTSQVGSIFNNPVSGVSPKTAPTADWWRALQQRLYELSANNGTRSPILYGLDSVHGVNYAYGATLFPQQIGIAATFDEDMAFTVGEVTSRESRYLGIPWAFAPILGIAVQPSWPRVYETFGEDPHVASMMGRGVIMGMQQPPPPTMFPDRCMNTSRNASCPQYALAACMKHFIGYSNSRTGRDRTPAWIPDNILMQYFAPSFQAAIDANVLSAMENYIQVNGRPVVASELYLNFLLREVMAFTGMLVTDYNEIFALVDWHYAARDYKEATMLSINATTIDMGMFQSTNYSLTFTEHLADLWANRNISTLRLTESAARVLTLKNKLGLFGGTPVPRPQSIPTDAYRNYTSTPANETCFFGCPEHHAAALNVTRASMTLLQNDGILPLRAATVGTKPIALIGPGCNSVPIMAGGWTNHWQGSTNASDFAYGTTLFDELSVTFPGATYSPGCSLNDGTVCTPEQLSDATTKAAAASVVIVCVGEAPYAEIQGDIYDLTLPGGQIQLVDAIYAVNPNIITVLIEGRPRLLKTIPSQSRAILHAYLPGPFGGQAIAETLTGVNNPSGRLPITYPKHANGAPLQYWRTYSADHSSYNDFAGVMVSDFDVEWEFGHGVSYGQFVYTDVVAELQEAAFIIVQVTVMNIGVAGWHSIPLFITQTGRPMPAEVKKLIQVRRLHLNNFESANVTFNVSITDALMYYNEVNCRFIAIRPTFVIIGTASSKEASPLRQELTLTLPKNYVAPSMNDGVIGLNSCPWGPYYMNKILASSFVATPTTSSPPSPPDESDEYFMSSVVCFVGGVIATCFLVFFVRRRNRHMRQDAVQLFEPSGV